MASLTKVRKQLITPLARQYNFASSSYQSCFGDWDTVDLTKLREDTVAYVDAHDPKTWHEDAQRTILRGVSFQTGTHKDTVDAFGRVNGKEYQSEPGVVDKVMEHMATFKPERDYREGCRRIEHDLLHKYGHILAGNQALDYHKQDGLTEIGEWAEAATVEQRLSDLLLEAEAKGEVVIRRNPSFVGCVSNFSNFLDLSRKCLRNMEVGIPVVVLSRSNTSQHMFRWFQLLLSLCEEHGVDTNMVTYLCANRSEKNRVMQAFPESPFYTTSSREVAASIKKTSHHLMASTGGPNTMVAEAMTPNVTQAAAWSTMIENSGQCTAMRTLVTNDDLGKDEVESLFNKEYLPIDTSADALKGKAFAGIFKGSPFHLEAGYDQLDDRSIAYRLNGGNFPEEIEEMWRETYLDVISRNLSEDRTVSDLSNWLNIHQPISLAVNGKEMPFELFNKLFERTALVVYTVGCESTPALTAQARPQDGEIFGEFPPRHELSMYTKFPMVIPSAPGYHSLYNPDHLKAKAKETFPMRKLADLVNKLTDDKARGYCQVLAEYLIDATQESPKVGGGNGGRTVLFGLQRSPIDTKSVIRSSDMNDIVPRLLPFLATNARQGVCVSTEKVVILEELRKYDIPCEVQSGEEFENWCSKHKPWNVIRPESMSEYALAGQFVSLLLPCGHIKSTRPNDTEFIETMKKSRKWLKVEMDVAKGH